MDFDTLEAGMGLWISTKQRYKKAVMVREAGHMRFIIKILASVFAGAIMFASAVQAQGNTGFGNSDVFVVAQVPVQATADSAKSARERARTQGLKTALDLLLRRLTAEEDWAYLPRLAQGREAPAYTGTAVDSNLTDETFALEDIDGKEAISLIPEQLPILTLSIEPMDEKSSRTSYSALMTYRFKPDSIRKLLTRARLPFSEAQSRTALILPVLQTKSGLYLWENNNPWARAWLARPLKNELTPMVLPLGDVEDVTSLSARQVMSFNANTLQALAKKYDVAQIIVAHSYLTEADSQYRLRVRLIDAFLAANARGAENYGPDSASDLYDSEDGFGTTGNAIKDTAGGKLAEGWFRGPNDDFPLLAARAVESIVARYAKDWKSRTLVDHSTVSVLRVNAYYSSLTEWAAINNALSSSPLVSSVKKGAVTQRAASLEVKVMGDVSQLILALKQRSLVFWSNDNVIWNIASAETAKSVRDRIIPASGNDLQGRSAENWGGQAEMSALQHQPDSLSPSPVERVGPQQLEQIQPDPLQQTLPNEGEPRNILSEEDLSILDEITGTTEPETSQ